LIAQIATPQSTDLRNQNPRLYRTTQNTTLQALLIELKRSCFMITKGFFTELGEVVDRHRTLSSERRSYTAAALPHRPTARFRWLLPTPGNVLLTILVIGSLLWAQKAGALSLYMPTAAITSTAGLPYHNRLADKNGAPLTQTVNMIFRLYSAASGGSPLWEEQWTGSNSVQVSDGLFNVMLGSLTPIPQAVITGNSNLYLGITY